MAVATTLDFVQQECVATAEALESRFTSRKKKRTAAAILRNIVIEQPHCGFCGSGPNRWCDLHPSPVKPKTWICDACAMYVARFGMISQRRDEHWLQLKDFAP